MQENLKIFVNAKVVNVFTGEVLSGNFGVKGDKFVFVDFSPERLVTKSFTNSERFNCEVIDLSGRFVTPTFIDGHIHIESSHLIPREFEKYALRSGVTKVVTDPHEIANVCGIDGIKFMLKNAKLLEVFVMIPSCVPASPFETSGAKITAEDIKNLLSFSDNVLGLAEVMNYPGVIEENEEVLAKIKVAKSKKKLIDGHAPLLSGAGLNKYIYEGIMSDHECTKGEEALEKLRLGMWIMVREGTASKNLNILKSLRKVKDLRKIMLVTDDISPLELEGYMLKTLRKATTYVSTIEAIQMVTINPATYFGLETGIKPGNKADFLVFDDLECFKLKEVWIKGKSLASYEALLKEGNLNDGLKLKGSINYTLKTEKDFFIPGIDFEEGGSRAQVIKPLKHSLITEELIFTKEEVKELLIDKKVNRIYVLERHEGSQRIGKGLVWKVLKDGAVASSYAHDSHNVVIVACSTKDATVAANTIKEMGGGFVAVRDGKVIAKVKLEVAGIMGTDGNRLNEELKNFYEKIKDLTYLDDLLLSMSFFSLSVIPELKLTDRGLVKNFNLVTLWI